MSRNKNDVKNLFEFWCEIKRTDDEQTIITESFPKGFQDEQTLKSIPTFAYPCDIDDSDTAQTYSFVLTTEDSTWRFGFCRHDTKTHSAMVLISHLPWHDTFFKLMVVLAKLRYTGNSKEFAAFLSETYNAGVPHPGRKLQVFYDGGESHFVFERPLAFLLPSIPENHNLKVYYNFALPKDMISVFAAMLAERRIIFTSRHLDRLSSCIQAAHAFLYPMVWQHIFIPVLPMKLKDYVSAPMPYLIGVPEMVLETVTPDELGDVVILNCDTRTFSSPFPDIDEMPSSIVAQMKKQLSKTQEHMGDRVSRIFLGALVQLLGGYRDAVEFHDTRKTFNINKFIESHPASFRPFIAKMADLQIFQLFIDERLEMLNTGRGFSDQFEEMTVCYYEKMRHRGRNYAFLKNVKEKTNPAVKSAVKSVKESSRGVKTAYKDLKSKFRDITPPNNTHFRSHLSSNSQHDRIDGFAVGKLGHHSAPSSPVFKRGGVTAGGFQYASPEAINGAAQHVRRAPPLAVSSSSAHIQPNGYANATHGVAHHNSHLAASPTVSPASSICSSEMNLSQELQNHPLFKSPIVDRSLKPSNSLEPNHRISAIRNGGPPARPPLPVTMQSLYAMPSAVAAVATPPSYYNHPYAPQQQLQQQQQLPPTAPRALPLQQTALQKHTTMPTIATLAHTSTPNKIFTTASIFDNPPEVQSPPVPPRRQCGNAVASSAAAVHAGINRLERNCWQDYSADCNLLQHDGLRSSLSSYTSSSSSSGSSSASFVSAMSTLSPQPPVPAPRLRKDKESLRSLQPQHLQVPGSLHSAPSNNTLHDLISLDDSNNTSFDLEDFDPLNQNARPLPLGAVSGGGGVSKKSTTLPPGTSASLMTSAGIAATSNNIKPMYAYYTPQHTRPPMQPPTMKPPPLPTSAPPPMPRPDEDYELLRKYGLDQFTLTTSPTNASSNSKANGAVVMAGMNNWTTFD